MLDICASYAEHMCLPCHRRKRSARADAAVTYVSLMTRVTYVSPMPQAQAERKSERAVSEPLTLQIVSELLRSDAVSQSGWVLDGYPRSIDQVTYVSLMTRVTYVSPVDGYPRATDQAQALKQAGVPLRRLVTVGISDEALVRRAVGRRIDPVTHTLYHLEGIGFPAPPDDDEVSDLVSLML